MRWQIEIDKMKVEQVQEYNNAVWEGGWGWGFWCAGAVGRSVGCVRVLSRSISRWVFLAEPAP